MGCTLAVGWTLRPPDGVSEPQLWAEWVLDHTAAVLELLARLDVPELERVPVRALQGVLR
jgi:hypothetical protein